MRFFPLRSLGEVIQRRKDSKRAESEVPVVADQFPRLEAKAAREETNGSRDNFCAPAGSDNTHKVAPGVLSAQSVCVRVSHQHDL